MDALGNPASVLLLGGTSDIALATARKYARPGVAMVLAARASERRTAAAAELSALGCTVTEVDFEARDTASHAASIDAAFADGDIDIAIVAFGVLGDAERAWTDASHALELAEVNFTAPVHTGVLLAERMRAQGHGTIVAFSSVAGEKVRRSNFVYGSTKAGMDGFYLGLGEALEPHGVRVVVVRPGFVTSKMTQGMGKAPLSVSPETVADATVAAVKQHKRVIWVPGAFRPIMLILKNLPHAIFRKLPL